MAAYSSIDKETFAWVKKEVNANLAGISKHLDDHKIDLNSARPTSLSLERLSKVVDLLHQIGGLLKILEIKSLSRLVGESELLVDSYLQSDSKVSCGSLIGLLKSSGILLSDSIERISLGQPENTMLVVELVNRVRGSRGLAAVEISSLFSPYIDVYPKLPARPSMRIGEYQQRVKSSRRHFQAQMLRWLRDSDLRSLRLLSKITEKLLAMSTFGSVSRLWWVACAYMDFLQHNDLQEKTIHARILRGLDDLLRKLENQGEPALVRDSGDELVKIMLFYVGIAEVRTDTMGVISKAFELDQYFPTLRGSNDVLDYAAVQLQIDSFAQQDKTDLSIIRQLVNAYFDENGETPQALNELSMQAANARKRFQSVDIFVLSALLVRIESVILALKDGVIEKTDDTGFHIASAIIFVENSLSGYERVDKNWVSKGESLLNTLESIESRHAVKNSNDNANITDSERATLIGVVSEEIEQNLRDIEVHLEEFANDHSNTELLVGIAPKVRQIRGALQVLGEQRMGLLLKMAEDQFNALYDGEVTASPVLIDALAASIETMDAYVAGLQQGRVGLEDMLDRSITELEIAIGKKTSRGDVETLLEESSSSLLLWLEHQSDFEIFARLKSNLRDIRSLAKKTGLDNVEELVREQNRLIDVISQEPAFLTDNITASLQSNLATIATEVIQLYGTEDVPDEGKFLNDTFDVDIIESDEQRIHDDMSLEDFVEIGSLDNSAGHVNVTHVVRERAASPAAELPDDPLIDVFIEESQELIKSARALHSKCRHDPHDKASLRDLRRIFHTLKGSSRMVGLHNIGEIAWFSESLFNYVLDTEKSITKSIMGFASEALDEFEAQLINGYASQSEIDVELWGNKTERVKVDEVALSAKFEEISLEEFSLPEVTEVTEVTESDSESDFIIIMDAEDSVDPEPYGVKLVDPTSERDDEELELDLTFMSPDVGELDISDRGTVDKSVDGKADDKDADDKKVSSKDNAIELESDDFDLDVFAEDSADITQSSYTHSQSFASEVSFSELSLSELSASFAVIDDKNMRDVFVAEVSKNLLVLNQCLGQQPLNINSDEKFFIALHTLLGNVRTLGLMPLSRVYELADDWCEKKRESDAEVTERERLALSEIITLTQSTVNNMVDIEPYFIVDETQWNLLERDFAEIHATLASESETPERSNDDLLNDSAESFVELDTVTMTLELSDDFETIEEASLDIFELDDDANDSLKLDSFEIDLSDTTSPISTTLGGSQLELTDAELGALGQADGEGNLSRAKVAAVFEGLEPIDDLLDPNSSNEVVDGAEPISLTSESVHEAEFLSFESLLEEQTKTSVGEDKLNDEPLPPPSESLLSAELANLIDKNSLSLGEVINALPITEQADKTNSDAPVSMLDDLAQVSDAKLADDPEGIDQELKNVFLEELRELYLTLDREVGSLSAFSDAPPVLANIMGVLHTIKGSSMVAEANKLSELTHQVETYLETTFIRNEDDLRAVKTTLEHYVDNLDSAAEQHRVGALIDVNAELIERIGNHQNSRDNDRARSDEPSPATVGSAENSLSGSATEVTKNAQDTTDHLHDVSLSELTPRAIRDQAAALRIQTETLDSLTNYVGDANMNRSQMREDVLSAKSKIDGLYENIQRFTEQLRALEIEADASITARSAQAPAQDINLENKEFDTLELDQYTKLQQLSRGLAENLDELTSIQNSLSGFVYNAETSLQRQDRLNKDLQDEIMQVRLVSFGGVATVLRQVVRRIARELGKEVDLELRGTDVRLDKSILDDITPALEHLLRNALDHGIEAPAQRKAANKTKVGKLVVECRQVAREIFINVSDDGAGLDLEKIRTKAIEEGLLSKEEPFKPDDALKYISRRGFSTSASLTTISGRGVGMDVVQGILRKLSGSMSLEVAEGNVGTNFQLRLPISLAVTNAVFVDIGSSQFAISTRTIERVVNVEADELSEALNTDNPSLELADREYVLIDAASYLGYESNVINATTRMPVILVSGGVNDIAVIVDEVLDTQEIVVKGLGGHLGEVPIYAGATVLADGGIILLLDLIGISHLESFSNSVNAVDSLAQNLPVVMVVDDSLTVRKSAERDLTNLGVNPVLVRDGIAAKKLLNTLRPNMILLDIEMPGMDGFELLEWVRGTADLSEIPVVMISSRATEKHIAKATSLGCNEFLGKPYILESLVTLLNRYLALESPITIDD